MSVAPLEAKKSQVNNYNMMGDLPVITQNGSFEQLKAKLVYSKTYE